MIPLNYSNLSPEDIPAEIERLKTEADRDIHASREHAHMRNQYILLIAAKEKLQAIRALERQQKAVEREKKRNASTLPYRRSKPHPKDA